MPKRAEMQVAESDDLRDEAPALAPLVVRDRDAARMLGISRSRFWQGVSIGEFPKPVKVGEATRWRIADLQRFVDEL